MSCTGNCECTPITSTAGPKGDTGATGATGPTGPTGPAASLGYTEYAATLTQTLTAAPTATVLKNNLGGTLVWARTDIGVYNATLASAFPDPAKVTLAVGTISGGYATLIDSDASVLSLVTYNNSNVETDALLSNTTVSIKVYP